MKIKFDKEEVRKIVKDYALSKLVNSSGNKEVTTKDDYDGIEIEIVDKESEATDD